WLEALALHRAQGGFDEQAVLAGVQESLEGHGHDGSLSWRESSGLTTALQRSRWSEAEIGMATLAARRRAYCALPAITRSFGRSPRAARWRKMAFDAASHWPAPSSRSAFHGPCWSSVSMG